MDRLPSGLGEQEEDKTNKQIFPKPMSPVKSRNGPGGITSGELGPLVLERKEYHDSDVGIEAFGLGHFLWFAQDTCNPLLVLLEFLPRSFMDFPCLGRLNPFSPTSQEQLANPIPSE
jgi:hypothetical protein